MRTHLVRIPYKSRSSEFVLYPLGDIHAGTVFCAEESIRRQVEIIRRDPKAYWVGMGDYAEFITPKDKRWDGSSIAPWVDRGDVARSQEKWVISLFKPIKNKCIGLLSGNHEESIRISFNQDVYRHICDALEVERLGYSCMVRLIFNRGMETQKGFSVDCHFEHGSGSAQTPGGVTQRLVRMFNDYIADVYAMGHVHRVKVENSSPLAIVGQRSLQIKAKPKAGAMTGCWFRTYEDNDGQPSYGEIKAYSPNVIGCPQFIFTPDKRRVEARYGSVYEHEV